MQLNFDITPRRTFLLLVTFIVFTLIGFAIISFRAPFTDESKLFTKSPNYVIWMVVMAVLTGLLPIFGLPLWRSLLMYYRDEWREHRLVIILSSIMLYILVMAPIPFVLIFTSLEFPLYGHITKMVIIFTLTFFAILPAAIGLWLINPAAEKAYAGETGSSDSYYQFIESYKSFRSDLQLYLAIAGILISMVVLSTEALRNALIDFQPANEDIFSASMAIVYGLYFALVLALIYVPTFLQLQKLGRNFIDKIYPVKSLVEYGEKKDRRDQVEELLNLKIGVFANLRSGLFILAPLVTSLFSSVIKF
jgi:MFS family permease